ncbi:MULTISPECIES: hypothetical protein [Bacillus mojavensis subgroup]|uniref:hypothetical protein n=1 Tax=Bacillus mojavensis subgroup TaxID=653388 RepID=UPI00166243D0|nr:hypothetical protein [Bacillus halotolerans]MBV7320299.1 hypothetical protein [Halalkalibacterium halodurans]QNS20851.1 hypothetical protein ICJ61_03115 [Bacillus halotolerans]
MLFVNQLQNWATFFVEMIIPVVSFVITYRQYVLQKNEMSTQNEYSKVTNYTQHGLYNEMNINVVHNKETEEYFSLQNQLEKAKQKKLKFERFSSIIDKVFISIIYITGAIIMITNISSAWDSNKGIMSNIQTFEASVMNAFQSIGQLTLHLIFGLSIALFLNLLLLSTKKVSIQNIFTWIYLLFLNIGAFLTLTVFKTKNLGDEFLKIVNEAPEPEENVTIHSLLEITPPFLMGLLIVASLIVATYLLKMLLIKDRFFSTKAKYNFGIAILLLFAIPLLFQFLI